MNSIQNFLQLLMIVNLAVMFAITVKFLFLNQYDRTRYMYIKVELFLSLFLFIFFSGSYIYLFFWQQIIHFM